MPSWSDLRRCRRRHQLRASSRSQWEHDGEVWEATVGEQLVRLEPRPKLHDNATVLAIFPGNPYMIVTTAVPLTRASSYWNNPISVGVPPQIKKQILFDAT